MEDGNVENEPLHRDRCLWHGSGNHTADWRSDSRPGGRRRFRPIIRRYQWQSNSLEWFIVTERTARRGATPSVIQLPRRRISRWWQLSDDPLRSSPLIMRIFFFVGLGLRRTNATRRCRFELLSPIRNTLRHIIVYLSAMITILVSRALARCN